MGDRCHMNIELGGEIKTVKDLETILQAIDDDGGSQPYDPNFKGGDADYLLACADAGTLPEFDFEEVNYANLDCLGTIQECGLDTLAFHGSGYDYCSGYETHNAVTGESYEWADATTGLISISAIKKIIASEKPPSETLDAIESAIKEEEANEWVELRKFAISDIVRDHIKNGPAKTKGTEHVMALLERTHEVGPI